MRVDKRLLILGVLLMVIGTVAAQQTVITLINQLVCRLVSVLYGISAAVATIVIVIAGIKWIGSSEDAGARAQAKATIIHAIIGLIIVIIALAIVNWAVAGTSVADFFTMNC